jgi:glycosyltransferase involved in cell wall biosynthesis
MSPSRRTAEVSALIPVGNRAANLLELYREYKQGLEQIGLAYEFIFILDGPKPQAAEAIRALQEQGEPVSSIALTREFGEATALMIGFAQARSGIVLTLPAYHQIEGAEIPKLLNALAEADLVVSHRWPRAGGFLERARRSAFHGLVHSVTGLRFRDLGCSARAMRRRVLDEISLYGDQHRFLPILANRQGFRVVEIDVRQSPADRFEGAYRPREYTHRVLDLLTVFFLVRFTKKPLRFFGMIGAITFGLGALLIAYLVVERLFFGQPLAERPALLLSSLMAVLGLQLFAIGLLGELIIFTHARQMKDYQVERIIQFPEQPDRTATG